MIDVLGLLVWLLLAGLVVALAWWVISLLPVPQNVRMLIFALVALLVLIALLQEIGLFGRPVLLIRR